jgi:hypothetical protein
VRSQIHTTGMRAACRLLWPAAYGDSTVLRGQQARVDEKVPN